ncbi:MAG: PQQ-binding-like beta-propeller repeat protein [Planctomycetaceae bacterium]|nr:PQQ-binding-like beta-propeller repeat protein [Planctomycetaceae bacterium]
MARLSSNSHRRRELWGFIFWIAVVPIGLANVPTTAVAQIVMATPAVSASDDEEKNLGGFQVQVDDSLETSFKDFERFAERKDWEKAFRAIEEIPSDKRVGMLKASGGMIVPAHSLIWQVVAELPAEGREAFRVFFDAKARELFRQIEQENPEPGNDVKVARQVFDEFFLTSVGDDAANLLGDAAFEQGDFRGAERYWRAILDHQPNTEIGELRLQVKRAIALLRSGRAKQFAAIVNDIEQRFPGEMVTLGGQDVEPVEFLKSLQSDSESSESTLGESNEEPVLAEGVLPEDTPIAWQVQYLSDAGKKMLDQSVRSNYWYRNGVETYVPPFTAIGGRLICNWFGIVFAIDVTTGKLQWRSEKFDKLNSQFGQMPHSQTNIEQFAVVAGGNTVLAISLNPEKLNNYREPFRLIAYELDTGKERWNSEKVSSLSSESFIGQPLMVGDNVLVATHERNGSKMTLRSLKLSDGSEDWSKELGTATQIQKSRRYQQQNPVPIFLKTNDAVLVLTNNGALIALDSLGKEVQWILKFKGPPSSAGDNFFWYGNEPLEDVIALHSQGAILEEDGTVYFKEACSNELFAVDLSKPEVVWKRPVEVEAVLAGVDENHLYVMTREMMAIDRESQKLRWARRLPIVGGGLSTVVGRDTVYVFTNRGIYCLDKQNGDQKAIYRGADLESNGGWIEVVGDRLVCVSNSTVTAYTPPWVDDSQNSQSDEDTDSTETSETSDAAKDTSG